MGIGRPICDYVINIVGFSKRFDEAVFVNVVRIRKRAIDIENCQIHISLCGTSPRRYEG